MPPTHQPTSLTPGPQVAAIIAICLLDYADFALIVALLLVNATISFIEEANADKAIKV